jgi:hypothetical protein
MEAAAAAKPMRRIVSLVGGRDSRRPDRDSGCDLLAEMNRRRRETAARRSAAARSAQPHAPTLLLVLSLLLIFHPELKPINCSQEPQIAADGGNAWQRLAAGQGQAAPEPAPQQTTSSQQPANDNARPIKGPVETNERKYLDGVLFASLACQVRDGGGERAAGVLARANETRDK